MVTLPHLMFVPVVLPLLAAVVMLLLGGRKRLKAIVNVFACVAGLGVALALMARVDVEEAGTIGVALASNWEAPFGIALVADRLSALMLVLTATVALATAVYSTGGWGRAGVYFHPLFQLQLMGLNGAFLTGDLFNLFVFFEVMLAASYGLQLHGSGPARVRTGLHYIAVNLIASSLFLVGLAMLYGVTGTLSMADIAAKVPFVHETDRGLLHAGASILAVAFLTKAAAWPLNFWLVPAYTAASAPVAALFALMTKVGFYTLLRLWTLIFADAAGPSAHFGSDALLVFGLLTMGGGVLGLLASFGLGRIAGFSVIVSAGTLLAALGVYETSVTAAALYYLPSATLGASAMFLLVELVGRTGIGDRAPLPQVELEPGDDTNLDEDEDALVGRAIPMSMALLGLAFIACALVVAGLPPLSGFVGKVLLMTALLSPEGFNATASAAPSTGAWWLFFMVLASGLVATASLARVGIRHFWSTADRPPPAMKLVEGAPVLALLLGCVWLTLHAEDVLRYTRATAASLHAPDAYISAVQATMPRPGPTRPVVERVVEGSAP